MIILWATKIDLVSERVVSTEKGLIAAEKYDAWYIEVSSKEGTNIDELFALITAKIQHQNELTI